MTLCFSALYPCLAGFGEILAQWLFFGGLLGKRAASLRILPLFLLSCLGIFLPLPVFCKFLLLAALLFLYGAVFCGRPAGYSLFASLLAVELTQICYGIFQPVLPFFAFLLCRAHPPLFGTLCMLAGDFLSLGLAFFCGRAILRQSVRWNTAQDIPLLPTALPLLLLLLVSGGIAHSFYGNTVTLDPANPAPSLLHLPMLLVQLLSMLSVFCILHTRQSVSALTAQNFFHARYTAETQARWRHTEALRHDMKNHLAVVRGLLEKGDSMSAAAYLAALDAAAAEISAPFQTNRPACDVLLTEKASCAESLGIAFHSTLQIPDSCPLEDMDLCIILANALDNAVNACSSLPPDAERFIRISSWLQGNFLLITIENSFNGSPHICPGTGLYNIRRTTKKYGGAAEIRTTGGVFRLHVLLSISQHSSRISHHFH